VHIRALPLSAVSVSPFVLPPVEIKKSKSRAGGTATAGAAMHPKTTDPSSWEVEVPW
jgi:hypothetical protein